MISAWVDSADSSDPSRNPGGIWAPVGVVTTGPVRILHHRAICRDASAQLATVALRVVLHSLDERDITVHTRVAGTEHVLAQRVSAGENRFEWTVQVRDPDLWWPHAMGDQPLHELEIDVRCGAESSDRRHERIGFRRLHMDQWVLRVNGERLFLKGATQGPISLWPAEATRADHERVLGLALDAHLDLIRIDDHIGRPELYEMSDELGMLLWQGLPLHGGFDRSVRAAAQRQAREAVDLLAPHPSVVMWGGRSWFDRSVISTLRSHDGSRPVVREPRPAHSPLTRALRGDERNLAGVLATVPRLGRFVSETDSGSGLLATASEERESDVIGFEIETLRRLKYRPTGGFCQFDLDQLGTVTHRALADACRPVMATADRLPAHVHPGDEIAVDLHVCSDLRSRIPGARLEARWRWTDGDLRQVFSGDVDADSVVFVGCATLVAPAITTPLTLDLRLTFTATEGDEFVDHIIDRRDETHVIAGDHHH